VEKRKKARMDHSLLINQSALVTKLKQGNIHTIHKQQKMGGMRSRKIKEQGNSSIFNR
jgi:hypothetical protein